MPGDRRWLLGEYEAALGLPTGFADRRATSSRGVDALKNAYERQLPSRQFLAGLMLAFLGVVEELLDSIGKERLENALDLYPPLQELRGRPLNTLTIAGPKANIGLRGYYNRAEIVIWNQLKRYDYPSCAPHATQAWPQHRAELDALFAFTPNERRAVAELVWQSILDLPEFAPRSLVGTTTRPFEAIIQHFSARETGEPAGAFLQALAFAYYRADAPNVTLETGKVGKGGARTGNVGDVDGWSGDQLVLSVEVKDLHITSDNLSAFAPFVNNLSPWPDATAIVVARSFSDDAISALLDQNLLTLDRHTMLENVKLWDLRKQQLATRELEYFLGRVQRNSKLTNRFDTFCADHKIGL